MVIMLALMAALFRRSNTVLSFRHRAIAPTAVAPVTSAAMVTLDLVTGELACDCLQIALQCLTRLLYCL